MEHGVGMNVIKPIVGKNIESINHFASEIDLSSCLGLLELLTDKPCIYFAGIGKNLHIANIVASTFNSLTIRAIAVDPVACVHGDMGLIEDGSTIVLISKSGNTAELEFFCEKIRKRNCGSKIILIHSNPSASLKRLSDYDLFVPFKEECDPWNRVPTCSLICYLILLHSIAMSLVDAKGVSVDDFYRNHPGGDIGRNSGHG
jgi:arabinose-5-phosphate isomerase